MLSPTSLRVLARKRLQRVYTGIEAGSGGLGLVFAGSAGCLRFSGRAVFVLKPPCCNVDSGNLDGLREFQLLICAPAWSNLVLPGLSLSAGTEEEEEDNRY